MLRIFFSKDELGIAGAVGWSTHTSKCSFHTGANDFLAMAVVLVCSPSTVRTAKGSGKLNSSRLASPLALYTLAVKKVSSNPEVGKDVGGSRLTLIDRSGSFNLKAMD